MTTLPPEFIQINATDIGLPLYLRYAGNHNFVGRPICGYYTDDLLILTRDAASALFSVQEELVTYGYSLAIYDAYRPTKAVHNFVEWAQNISDIKNKEIFYPYVKKSDLFADGYIANKSGHSRGSTVDISIIELNKFFSHNPVLSYRPLANGNKTMPFYDDNTIDMGTSFDLFDPVSYYDNREISTQQYTNRMLLQQTMVKHGFTPYEQEWWHFTLANEPYPDTYFDFDIGTPSNTDCDTIYTNNT